MESHQTQYWWITVEHFIKEQIGFRTKLPNGLLECATESRPRPGGGHTDVLLFGDTMPGAKNGYIISQMAAISDAEIKGN